MDNGTYTPVPPGYGEVSWEKDERVQKIHDLMEEKKELLLRIRKLERENAELKAEKSRMEAGTGHMLEKFEGLAKPLIKFINENFDPHTTITIGPLGAEITRGEMAFRTEEFLAD